MKTSKLNNIAWVFFALMLTSTTVSAQGWGNGNRSNHNSNQNCISSISGLSDKQQKQIQEMEEKHYEAMAEFRTERQSTTNAIEKSELRTDMLKKVEAHRNSVKKLLSDEQQKQYEQLHTRGNYGQNQRYVNGRGNRNFRERGDGNQQFVRGNACNLNGNNRGRGRNFQNGKGNGNKANYAMHGNGSQGRNINYGRGNNRFNSRTNRVGQGRKNIVTSNIEVIEEK